MLRTVLIATAFLLAGTISAAIAEAPTKGLDDWFELVGWPSERFQALDRDEPLAGVEESQLLALAKSFSRLPAESIAEAATPLTPEPELPGQVVTLSGAALAAERIDIAKAPPYYRVRVAVAGRSVPIKVLTLSAPTSWFKQGANRTEGVLNQPVECEGIAIRSGGANTLIVSPRLRWIPTVADGEQVNYGEALLGSVGVDLGLLDHFTDGRGLSAQESHPFYQSLSACQKYSGRQLLRAAGENLPRYIEPWERRLVEEGTQRRLATAVVEQFREGRYSVAPLFNDAVNQRGQLFAFEGVARRAVRIDLTLSRDGTPSRLPEWYGIDYYYELELFPPDSQNLPLVFCVLSLPEGFPTGDKIEEPVRVAGFFLKRWAYRTRKPSEAPVGGDHRQLAPLLVGHGPVRLSAPPAEPRSWEQALAGMAFVGVLGIIAYALHRQGMADRRFEKATLSRFKGEGPRSGGRG